MESLHPLEVRCAFCGAGKSVPCLDIDNAIGNKITVGSGLALPGYHPDRIYYANAIVKEDDLDRREIISKLTNFIYNSVSDLSIRSSSELAIATLGVLTTAEEEILLRLIADKTNLSLPELIAIVIRI